jgi:hypothetical protein
MPTPAICGMQIADTFQFLSIMQSLLSGTVRRLQTGTHKMRFSRLIPTAVALAALVSLADPARGLELPRPGIDPRIVARLPKMGSRPHAFFMREDQLIQIDVSTVVKRGDPALLAQTAHALHRYAQIDFPMIQKAETDMRNPSSGPVKLHFKAFGFSTFALVKRTPLAQIHEDGWTASWQLLNVPEQRDFSVFDGSVYVKPLEGDRVYLRYCLNIQSKYTPPAWMMTLIFDNVGRKLARDAVRAIVRASMREEEEEEARRRYRN